MAVAIWWLDIFMVWHTIYIYNQHSESKASYWIVLIVWLVDLALYDLFFNIPFYLFSAYVAYLWFDTVKQLLFNKVNKKTKQEERYTTTPTYIENITCNQEKLKHTPIIHAKHSGGAGYIADIEFSYYDSKGDRSHRRVQVISIDDEYFEGFCHKANAIRTFVIGRVRGKVIDRETGELLPPKLWAENARMAPGNSGIVQSRGFTKKTYSEYRKPAGPEILFTGFLKKRRSELETLAELNGMTVRQNVTQNLNYLCKGKTAGYAKVERAEAQGVSIIDENEFLEMLN